MSDKIHTQQAVTPIRNGKDVVLYIHGHGSLTMGRDAAHEIARGIMRVVAEIDAIDKRVRPWPPLSTKQ